MAHAPTLRGSASYADSETEGSLQRTPATPFDASPDNQVDSTVYGLTLEMPLFSGGAISAERRRAAQEFISAREQRINLSRNTVTNARSLHMTVLSDVARVAARRQSIVSSQSALDATQAGYEVGTRNIVDVLNAQNALYSAQRDYANARYDYILNMLRLKEQAGLLSPEDIYALDNSLEEPPAPTASGNG
jgi:outer membrane protein